MADILEDTRDDSRWELTMREPMRVDRPVRLRPWLWHTARAAGGSG
jgi:hypothetical protein